MKRFGATDKTMQPMDENSIFLVRLHLLTVMVKSALKGYPVGEYRKEAVIENANEIHRLVEGMNMGFLDLSTSSHLFKQRIKLLCVMAIAIVSESYPLGIHRQQAVMENLETIAGYAFPKKQFQGFYDILRVA